MLITRREALGRISAGFLFVSAGRIWAQSANSTDPWSKEQLLDAETLAKQIASRKDGSPIVVCVGFGRLYRAAHIRGAVFHGPASTAEGLEDFKKWAQGIPRGKSVVIYCGCCPIAHCPNLRPAFEALHSLRFSQLRVLNLPTGFAADWMEKGYPTDKKS